MSAVISEGHWDPEEYDDASIMLSNVKSTYIFLASMYSDDFDYNHAMTSTALAVGQCTEDSSVELSQFHKGFGLGSSVDTELT